MYDVLHITYDILDSVYYITCKIRATYNDIQPTRLDYPILSYHTLSYPTPYYASSIDYATLRYTTLYCNMLYHALLTAPDEVQRQLPW